MVCLRGTAGRFLASSNFAENKQLFCDDQDIYVQIETFVSELEASVVVKVLESTPEHACCKPSVSSRLNW